MKAGDVVRWTFVQGDGQRKMRPAIIIGAVPPFNDWLVCAVSTQLHREVKNLDLLLDANNPDHEPGLAEEMADIAGRRTVTSSGAETYLAYDLRACLPKAGHQQRIDLLDVSHHKLPIFS